MVLNTKETMNTMKRNLIEYKKYFLGNYQSDNNENIQRIQKLETTKKKQ